MSKGKWFVSTGKDNLLNAWRTPYGASIFQVKSINISSTHPGSKWKVCVCAPNVFGFKRAYTQTILGKADREMFGRGLLLELV